MKKLEDRLLTIAEAAERLNVKERFIRGLISGKRIPYSKVGHYVRIHESDLEAFIEAGRVEAQS